VSKEEKTKISEECVGLGSPSEPPPPSDVLVCAEEALGHKIDGPINDDEAENIRQSCAPPEDQDGVAPPPGGSDEANKQVAFCDANPNDPHCENFVPPHDGDQSLPPLDGEGGGLPPIDDGLAKLCAENPRDPKCGGDATPPPPPPPDGGGEKHTLSPEEELKEHCAANPSDPKCV
jgi:hypothetical protein